MVCEKVHNFEEKNISLGFFFPSFPQLLIYENAQIFHRKIWYTAMCSFSKNIYIDPLDPIRLSVSQPLKIWWCFIYKLLLIFFLIIYLVITKLICLVYKTKQIISMILWPFGTNSASKTDFLNWDCLLPLIWYHVVRT